MKKLITICVVVLLAIAVQSSATVSFDMGGFTIEFEEPVAGNSWEQGINLIGGNFDLVAVKMMSAGDSFETDTLSGFSDGSWALLYENTPPTPTIASAEGDSTASLSFVINFPDPMVGNPLNYDLVVFNGNNIMFRVNADWRLLTETDPSPTLTLTPGTWNPDRSTVPEPATMVILSLGALFCARLKRR